MPAGGNVTVVTQFRILTDCNRLIVAAPQLRPVLTAVCDITFDKNMNVKYERCLGGGLAFTAVRHIVYVSLSVSARREAGLVRNNPPEFYYLAAMTGWRNIGLYSSCRLQNSSSPVCSAAVVQYNADPSAIT